VTDLGKFYDFWREWFAQTPEQKEPWRRVKDPAKGINRGNWYPPFSEAPGYGEPDPKEYVHWTLKDYWGQSVHTHPKFGGLETLHLFWECYDRAWGFCSANYLDEVNIAVNPKDCVLRILHYPPTPNGRVGQAHRDFDLLTVAVPGTAPGLEVFDPRGCKHTGCLPEDGCGWRGQEKGIQIGEMLEIYTQSEPRFSHVDGPALEATLHRVHTPPNTERYKAVFFYLPSNDFELRPGYTAGDYLKEVMAKAGTANGAKL
jgi:hypothetical protein